MIWASTACGDGSSALSGTDSGHGRSLFLVLRKQTPVKFSDLSLLLVSLAALTSPLRGQCQRAKLLSSDMQGGDKFGRSLALSGTTAIIGAPYDHPATSQFGAAYFFEWNGSTWVQAQKVQASDPAYGASFGISVAIDGDVAVVGAPNDDALAFQSGAAYVFRRVGGTWIEEQKLKANDPTVGAAIGNAVGVLGDTVFIGAEHDHQSGWYAGAAYVFERSGGTWTQTQKIFSSDSDDGDDFGCSLSLSGARVLIGAQTDDSTVPLSNRGAAYIFENTAGVWIQEQKLTASDAGDNDYMGFSVSLDGTTALVGAHENHGPPPHAGAAYVFEFQQGAWSQTQRLTAGDPSVADNFGVGVAVSGDAAVIGATGDDDTGLESGSAYSFRRVGSTWTQTGKLLALDGGDSNLFGFRTAISGETVLVSAPFDDDACPPNPCFSGSAYVFALPIDSSQYCSCCVQNSPCGNPDCFGGCRHQLGYGAILSACGSGDELLDDLELHTTSLPPNKFGFVFMSTAQSSVPTFNGLRCVGGGGAPLFRYPIQNAGALGRFVRGPGIVAWSQSHFPLAGRIAGNQTWNFQTWFRDPMGECSATTNYSNAVTVAFHP
jgi:hypothetical protein